MAIPEKPLEVTADIQQMTIGELKIFSKKGFDFFDFRQFMIDHTNWTEAEIDSITLAEMEAVAMQLGEALKAKAVPLPS